MPSLQRPGTSKARGPPWGLGEDSSEAAPSRTWRWAFLGGKAECLPSRGPPNVREPVLVPCASATRRPRRAGNSKRAYEPLGDARRSALAVATASSRPSRSIASRWLHTKPPMRAWAAGPGARRMARARRHAASRCSACGERGLRRGLDSLPCRDARAWAAFAGIGIAGAGSGNSPMPRIAMPIAPSIS